MRQVDEIREYVKRNYIEPARNKGEEKITINAGEVDIRMRLGRVPNVNNALIRKLEELCKVRLIKTEGNLQSTTGTYTYEILSKAKEEGNEPTVIPDDKVKEEIIKPKMFCPLHQKISIGDLRIENSRPILKCGNGGNCNKPFEINWDIFVLDTNVLANGLFSDLSNIDFFKGKTILIPETVVDEVNNWKNPQHKNYGLYKIAMEELKKIRYAYDQKNLIYKKIGTDPKIGRAHV